MIASGFWNHSFSKRFFSTENFENVKAYWVKQFDLMLASFFNDGLYLPEANGTLTITTVLPYSRTFRVLAHLEAPLRSCHQPTCYDKMNSVFDEVPLFKNTRLQSLYSNYSNLKDVNPEGYNANISAWETLLLQCFRSHTFKSSITIPAGELLDTLASPQYGRPQSLDLVIQSLLDKRVILPWSMYKARDIRLSSVSGSFSLGNIWFKIQSIYDLSFHSPKSALHSSSESYLHIPSLISLANSIYKALNEIVKAQGCYSARLYNLDMILTFLQALHPNLSDGDVEAILVYLSREKKDFAIHRSFENDQIIAVKVGDAQNISTRDLQVLEVKSGIKRLEHQAATIENVVSRQIPLQLKHLMHTNVPTFRLENLLRKKQRAVKSLRLISKASSELTLVLSKIDEAESNKSMYSCLTSAKTVLSVINKELSVADIDNLSDELAIQMAIADEVSDAMDIRNKQSEDELDEELRMMEMKIKNTSEPNLDKKVIGRENDIEPSPDKVSQLSYLKEDRSLSSLVRDLSISTETLDGSEEREKSISTKKKVLEMPTSV